MSRLALVTGGTRGIGLAISRHLAAGGCRVLLNYRSDLESAKRGLEQIREAGGEAELVQCDVSDSEAAAKMFALIRREYGQLDHFVSNAGITDDGYGIMMSPKKWQSVIDTNLNGAFGCIRSAARQMSARRSGSIVAIASTSAVNAPAGQSNYAASKAGLVAAIRVLAKEVGQFGVRVNAVLPGFVETAMTRTVPGDQLQQHLDHVPLGRIAVADDVAPAVSFLLSDAASYITGSTLTIDGGLTC